MTAALVLDRATAGAEPRWGTITELLEASGAYARLYAAQFAQALAEVD